MEEKLDKELKKIKADIDEINEKKISLLKQMDQCKKEDEEY